MFQTNKPPNCVDTVVPIHNDEFAQFDYEPCLPLELFKMFWFDENKKRNVLV
jgi:hypothetical protein